MLEYLAVFNGGMRLASAEIGSDSNFGLGTSVIIIDAYQSALIRKDNMSSDYHTVFTDSGRSALRLALNQLPIGAGIVLLCLLSCATVLLQRYYGKR